MGSILSASRLDVFFRLTLSRFASPFKMLTPIFTHIPGLILEALGGADPDGEGIAGGSGFSRTGKERGERGSGRFFATVLEVGAADVIVDIC